MLRTRFRDRHVLVVARGPGHKRDLRMVNTYVRDFRPVLVGIDGGADAIVEAGWKPHLIVGDMDSVSDATLALGAEIVVHAYVGRRGARRRAAPAARAPLPHRLRRRASARTSRSCSPTRRARS